MPDIQKLNENKERIISNLRIRGPSLPIHIARTISVSPLFASAFLSELYAEDKIKISHIRVGSSPLYFLSGQEPLLENFIEYLNHKEKEAFSVLKKNLVLDDNEQEPAIRVALRAIKDFAVPIKVKINEESKLFWKYFQLSDQDVKEEIQKILAEPKKEEIKKIKSEEKIEPKEPEVKLKLEEKLIPGQIIEKSLQAIEKEFSEQDKEKKESKEKFEKKKRQKDKTYDFPSNIKGYLTAKDIEILSSILEKKKEFTAKIRIDTLFGKQEFYLIAKDKKKVNEDDLTLALQRAQSEKMPAIFMSSGELDKKAKEYLSGWSSLIKFERIKF